MPKETQRQTTWNRRAFSRQTRRGAVVVAGTGLGVPSRVLESKERIRVGWIGAGSRGQEILPLALRCPNVEGAAVADVYTQEIV